MRQIKALAGRFQAYLAAALVVLASMFTVAPAAASSLTDAVSTAVATAQGDLTTIAQAVILALLAFWAVRKVGQKLGWW
jgi:energy-converting hydrogenase Eha subunit E